MAGRSHTRKRKNDVKRARVRLARRVTPANRAAKTKPWAADTNDQRRNRDPRNA